MIDFEKNLLTTLLLGAIGLMGLIGVAFIGVYFITDVDFVDPADERAVALNPVEAPETGLLALDEYATIVQRPVFFPDRQLPVLEENQSTEVVEIAPIPEPDPVEPLKAAIAGIIITPESRIAMINDEVAGKVMIMREGMSLEGDQAAWQLQSITPRKADFVSVDGQSSALELQVYTEGLVAGNSGIVSKDAQSNDQASAAAVDEAEAQSRADLIRQRVAERRAELRARAQERAEQQEQTEQEP